MRDRAMLLTGLLVLLALVTIGPGLITRHRQDACSATDIGCNTAPDAQDQPVAPDGRVAGNAGDLIALYCQYRYRNIAVYAIDHSVGVYLTTFSIDALQTAGAHGLTVDLGDKGVASMAMTGFDKFYVTLQGGMIATEGLGIYAKLFTCKF